MVGSVNWFMQMGFKCTDVIWKSYMIMLLCDYLKELCDYLKDLCDYVIMKELCDYVDELCDYDLKEKNNPQCGLILDE